MSFEDFERPVETKEMMVGLEMPGVGVFDRAR
jgi:hypothetical protein